VRKKKLLIHSLVFSPDGVSTAYLYNDLAIGFKEAGFDVVVLTTTPHYNLVKEDILKQPLTKRWGGLYYTSIFKGISVIHVPQKKFRSTFIRIIGFVYWHILSFFLGILQRNISVILSPSPPLTIGVVSSLIGKIKRAKIIYNVQEIYPDLLINQGKLRSGILRSILYSVERFVYNRSDAVITIDDIFYKTIIGRINRSSKLVVIPNFVDTDMYRPLTAEECFLNTDLFPAKTGLNLMYAGNIGKAQYWEPLLHLAKAFKDAAVQFWVIGEGVQKMELQQEIERLNIQNIHLLPYQPRDKMVSIIAYADIHFIFMNPQTDGHGFPSKVYTIMACKKPMMILSGKATPLVNFLADKHCAFLITENDNADRYRAMESVIYDVLDNPDQLEQMGQHGFNVIEKQYSRHAVVKQYIGLVETLLQQQ
jgi:colanic acid biosynthesis glycosyl transferase WcaI